MCARELRSGRELNIWGDELRRRSTAPLNTGPDSLLVAYAAAAEIGCFLELGWRPPVNILDLFAEHRVETNGKQLPLGDSLLGALSIRGLAHMDAGDKDEMRKLIMSKRTLAEYSGEERIRTQAYCREDVLALEALLPKMKLHNLSFALHRGRYGPAVARMQAAGVPIDVPLHRSLFENREGLKRDLIDEVDIQFGIYVDGQRKTSLFEQWLREHGLYSSWPRTPTGLPVSDGDSLEEQIMLHPELPQLRLLHELDATLQQMELGDLPIGEDGRHRFSVHPFRTITGRNAPTGGKDLSGQALPFIFGAAKWMRGLIKPSPGYGFAYLDYAAQEVAIAAALSHDARLAEHYSSGDPYWRFAVATGLDSRGDYVTVRALVKVLFLAIGYGMGPRGLAAKAGVSLAEAKELLALHAATYPDFTRWRENVVDWGYLHGELCTSFGWRRVGCADVATKRHQKKPLSPQEEAKRWGRGVPPTELMNWPIQSAGADMMRIACIASTEAGIGLIVPVHDGFLIEAPLDRLAHDIDRFESIMRQSSEIVTRGLTIRVETKPVLYPDRYMDKDGKAMWDRIIGMHEKKIRKAVA
jgi:DNA polymerase I